MSNLIVEEFYAMDYGPAPEDPKEVERWLDEHKRTFDLYIGGKWRKPVSGEYFATSNPATGDKIADVAQAGAADVDAAVKAARKALPTWQALSGHQRARYLYALARQVQKHSRRLAVLETIDNGKTIRESRDLDIPLVARHFYHHAGWAQLLESEFPGYTACGVVGQVIPWNFPLLMFAWKVAPALAAGNTVVIKPAEYTPLTALALAELADEIGLPPGVLNVINGDGRTGALLVEHDDIDKVAFTGSTEVGRMIRKATAASSKKLSLELGGKSPFIVFDDADLDSAVEGLVDGIWLNQGQVCCAGSRLLVQERVAEVLYEKIRARMKTLRVGSPLDKAVDIGAIVAPVQLERIRSLVDQGVTEGATCWQPESALPARGLYFPPTLLTGVHPTATVAQEEIFGPVLAAMTFRTPAEAVELANNTAYGLAASIWSESINVALDVASQVKAGVVWVNSTNLFDASCGFGGYRESGYGREGGREGMYEYLETTWHKKANHKRATKPAPVAEANGNGALHSIDRTVKQYIGGKQARPDSGYSFPVYGRDGKLIGEAPLGNRKDIRNAVEAARSAGKWAKAPAHTRAQVLYYIAENLIQRRGEIAAELAKMVGEEQAGAEVELSIERIFTYAAWCDKYDGQVHNPPMRNVALAMNEAIGVVGILCPTEAPLLGLMSLVLPAIAAGNTVVAVPSEKHATIIGDLYQVFDTSDLPGGVVNIVAGRPAELAKTLAEHDDVDAIWSFREPADATLVKAASIGNLKQVWTNDRHDIDWFDAKQNEGRYFMRHATQIKNIWVPYGE
ncbi:aldehyde dehydrogenase family protein [Edaphobacter bradus]|uniref:aldehyde dehydrogenase family protein n=1 Tax=Edaphobacter bradus TaxID=2259016 RepID=UPI0021DF5331|nr:aldehyde dehydrogenase family protein [Edaphobacter bradus]